MHGDSVRCSGGEELLGIRVNNLAANLAAENESGGSLSFTLQLLLLILNSNCRLPLCMNQEEYSSSRVRGISSFRDHVTPPSIAMPALQQQNLKLSAFQLMVI